MWCIKVFPIQIGIFICILFIFVCKLKCVSELFIFFLKFLKELTNTFKLTHKNDQNLNKTS